MIGPQHIEHLIRYFDGVDRALSGRLLRPNPPDEPALTNELCALMDIETQRRERSLEFNIDRLNGALASCGDDLKFDFRIDTHPYTTKMESLVSGSDFGLIIEFINHVLPNESWYMPYLLQAKRLFRSKSSQEYDEEASFRSIESRQHEYLKRLSEKFGKRYFQYILHCPPVSNLTPQTSVKVRALHSRNLADRLYDYVDGLSLFDYLKRTEGLIDSGIWLAPIQPKPNRLVHFHNKAFQAALPFTWFFLKHVRYSRLSSDSGERSWDINNPNLSEEVRKLLRDVISGDPSAIEQFLREVHDAPGPDLPKLAILPKSTIRITATVGASLPPDTRRAFQS